MNGKKYDGYRSFAYLTPGEDYQVFPLSRAVGRVPSHMIELDETQEQRVQSIFKRCPIVSLRDHGFIVPERREDIIPYCRQLHTFYHYEGLAQSGIDIIIENFMDGIALATSLNGLKWDDVIYTLGIRYADIAHQQTVYIARTFRDLTEAKRRKQIALLPSLEAANILENELDRVDILYGLGIRCMGITYNEANTLGAGLAEARDGGLTNFGKKVIRRMNKLGMLIDISHCGDRTSLDVIEESEHPVLITHAGARKIWNSPRMKPDEVLKACAARGGVIGICAAPNTTLSSSHKEHCIDSVMEHFEYIVDLVGIDHVAFGPDTLYGDHVALQHAFDERLAISTSHGTENENRKDSPYVVGLENPTEAMQNIVRWLVKRNYALRDIEKVVGRNALRVMKQVLKP